MSIPYCSGRQTNKTTMAQRIKSELENFKKQSSTPLNANPLLWWKTNESHSPLLARLAKNLLGIPSTSVPSERYSAQRGT